jgi:hypothetical protein
VLSRLNKASHYNGFLFSNLYKTMKSFNPPIRTLMGPGPSDVHPRILSAMARPTIGHLDPAFVGMMNETKEGLKTIFKTENELTMPVSAPGSAGMETCFANLVEPGDKVVVCINGVFGMRMQENITRFDGVAVVVEDDWGTAVSLDKVEQTLKDNADAKILAFVHAETSTGARSDAKALSSVADHPVRVFCSGRTDAGVHAIEQVIHMPDFCNCHPWKSLPIYSTPNAIFIFVNPLYINSAVNFCHLTYHP